MRYVSSIIKCLTVAIILLTELMAGMLQFHSHDCLGHAKFATSVLNHAVGCNLDHDAHGPVSPQSPMGGNHESCGMHLDKCDVNPSGENYLSSIVQPAIAEPIVFSPSDCGIQEVSLESQWGNRSVLNRLKDLIKVVEPKRGSPTVESSLC